MNIKALLIGVLILAASDSAVAQNDFEVRWNAYSSGDTVEDNPFNGSFTISNVGETTIPANDTIWFGYFIDGDKYDIALNPEMVSGEVMESDFEPGEEFVVINNFSWPLLGSGITVEICAVVYGEGFESYTGELYTGDVDGTNNTDCLYAVLPEYSVELVESDQKDEMSLSFYNQRLYFENVNKSSDQNAFIEVYNIFGELVYQESVTSLQDVQSIDLSQLTSGTYIGKLVSQNQEVVEKFVVTD